MKIMVQMPSGVSSVSVGGQSYEADESGVFHLDSPEHVAPLVALGGTELTESGAPGRTSVLIGSDSLPATIDVGGSEPMQLGTLVADTHKRTGLTVDEWNNIPQRARDIFLSYQLATITGQVGDVSQISSERDDLAAQVESLELECKSLREQLDALRATPDQGDLNGDDEGTLLDFHTLTKDQINEWLVANGGEPVDGRKDDLVAAAEALREKLNESGAE